MEERSCSDSVAVAAFDENAATKFGESSEHGHFAHVDGRDKKTWFDRRHHQHIEIGHMIADDQKILSIHSLED